VIRFQNSKIPKTPQIVFPNSNIPIKISLIFREERPLGVISTLSPTQKITPPSKKFLSRVHFQDALIIASLGLDAKLSMLSQHIGHVAQKVSAMSIVLNSSISAQANDSAVVSTALKTIKAHLVDDRIINITLAVVAVALTLAGFVHLGERGRGRVGRA
jgi:hypothetical protein